MSNTFVERMHMEKPDTLALQPRYGYYVWYFMAVAICFLVLGRITSLLGKHYHFRCLSRSTALLRAFSSRKPARLPTLGACFLVGSFALFTGLVTFGNTAYVNGEGGSYPIGLRSGWMATAMLPLLIMLAMKRNILSVIIGISYEKLLVLHPYGGWICLLLSLVHTIALLIRADRADRTLTSPWLTTIQSPRYTSGLGAIAALLVLCCASLPPLSLRRRSYELFYATHVLAGIAFLGCMAKHIAYLLPEPMQGALGGQGLDDVPPQTYVYVAAAIWGSSIFWRHGKVVGHVAGRVVRGQGVERASVEVLPGGQIMRVVIPTSKRWTPGQHAFLRFPTCRPLESHPFTIMSVPTSGETATLVSNMGSTDRDIEKGFGMDGCLTIKGTTFVLDSALLKGSQHGSFSSTSPAPTLASHDTCEDQDQAQNQSQSQNQMEFLVRVGAGFTSVLHARAGSFQDTHPGMAYTLPVLVDGPYSGPGTARRFDSVLIVAGGTGISFALPILEDLVVNASVHTQDVHFVWVVKDNDLVNAVMPRLRAIAARSSGGAVKLKVSLYTTGAAAVLSASSLDALDAFNALDSLKCPQPSLSKPKAFDHHDYHNGKELNGAQDGLPVSYKVAQPRSLRTTKPFRGRGHRRVDSDATLVDEPMDGTCVEKVEQDFMIEVARGRPDMRDILREMVNGSNSSDGINTGRERHGKGMRSMAAATCGPLGLTRGVANAVAEEQMRIARGKSKFSEIVLHTEVFGW